MKQWLRQHRYALRVALRHLIRQPFSSLANIFVIALCLMLPLIGTVVLSSTQPVLGRLAVNPQITLFLTRAVDSTPMDRIAQRLQAEHGAAIASVRTVPRDQALAQLQRHPGWSDALAVLPENPLPDAIVVTLRPNAETHAALAQQWQQWEAVDRVQLDSAWVQRLHAIVETLRMALNLLALGVGVAVLAATFNTVRMQALGQRAEIEVVRLLGATESFVRRPFLYSGALSGIAAGLLALAATAAALAPLNAVLDPLAASYGAAFALHLPPASTLLLALAGVAALCALAARWSVTRATRV